MTDKEKNLLRRLRWAQYGLYADVSRAAGGGKRGKAAADAWWAAEMEPKWRQLGAQGLAALPVEWLNNPWLQRKGPWGKGLGNELLAAYQAVKGPALPNVLDNAVQDVMQRQANTFRKMRGRGGTDLTGGLLGNPLTTRGRMWPL